jgi:hypothetical protein
VTVDLSVTVELVDGSETLNDASTVTVNPSSLTFNNWDSPKDFTVSVSGWDTGLGT